MAKLAASFRQSALRRGILIGPDSTPAELPTSQAVAFAATVEFANLGFITNPDELRELPVDAIVDSLAQARKVIGADREMTPIYPGFPEQVESLSTLTLLVEQILHYWTGGTFLPNYPTVAREGLPIEDMLRNARKLVIVPAWVAAEAVIAELTASSVAISQDDRTLLWDAVNVRYSTPPLLADPAAAHRDISEVARSASNGENLQVFISALVAKIGAESSALSREVILQAAVPAVRSLDTLLRVVLAIYAEPAAEKWASNFERAVENLSDSNARAVRYLSIPRGARRLIMGRLGELSAGFHADNLLTRSNLWRGVIRTAHAFDLKLSEPSLRAANIIAGNIEHRTVNSLVEEALENHETGRAAELLVAHQPGNLLRRLVAILRLTEKQEDADVLAAAVVEVGHRAALTTLISSYNGVLAANDEHARVTRVAGLNNSMQNRTAAKIDPNYQATILGAIDSSMVAALSKKPAPTGPVGTTSSMAVPLVRRDAATADRILERGEELTVAGAGDVLRIFGHWTNNQSDSGYMDIGAVILDGDFKKVAVSTWNSWQHARSWSTYSGDKNVYPGDSAPEFIDVKLADLAKLFPSAEWVVMTVQSYSGWPIKDVDFIAGAMLRSTPQAGEVFDPRSVTAAFKPTTSSTQAVPFAVNLASGRLIWIDSSNGSDQSGLSATDDESIGAIVYDEIARPRLSLGELAALWASAHGAETTSEEVDREELLKLL